MCLIDWPQTLYVSGELIIILFKFKDKLQPPRFLGKRAFKSCNKFIELDIISNYSVGVSINYKIRVRFFCIVMQKCI